jgi:hypothetical protein
MSGTTNATSVPQPTFGTTGFQAPAESAILTGVLADLNAAFGGNLNTALSTPQGQLATTFAAIIGDMYAQFLYYCNQVDPAYASGRMQDAIARIYFIYRNPAQATVVQATCVGLPGVTIPTGSLAQATDGNLYSCTSGGTIPQTGSISLSFTCMTTGAITCPAGTLNRIYRTLPGWDTITNPADGVIGSAVESRSAFEQRRQQSVAKNSVGALSAVQGAVLAVPGVLDAYTTENNTSGVITLDGVTIPANSLYVCVSGGNASAVAQAIWSKKAPGCGYSGNTTVTVQDTNSGYTTPYPSYSVSFQTAAAQPLFVTVTIVNSVQVPSNALALVQTAILNAFAGADNGPRARIGSTIFASRFYAGIAALGAWAQIISITLGSTAVVASNFTGSITGNTMTVTAVTSGALAVGQNVVAAGVPDGVQITAMAGGASGGVGSYTINLPQTISSEAMSTVAATANSVAIGVAHVPVLSAANISLDIA